VSNASPTPAGGWYADPLDAAQLRWWDGANWTQQTTPATSSQSAVPVTLAAAPDPTPTPASGQPIVPVDAGPKMYYPSTAGAPAWSMPTRTVEAPHRASGDEPVPATSTAGAATLSPSVFPTAAPAPVTAPGPSGALFPGLVPTSSAPPPAVIAGGPVIAGSPDSAGSPVIAQPLSAEPAPAPVEYQPLAPSTPAFDYGPPTLPALPASPSFPALPTLPGSPAFPALPTLPASPAEFWPTQNPSSAPNPGVYPTFDPNFEPTFDPNAAQRRAVPVVAFSSRDPLNPTSAARPGLRSYASAPIGPSGSTYTAGLWLIVLAPLLNVAAIFGATQLSMSAPATLLSIGFPVVITVIFVLSLAAAQFDRNALARRGYFDLASPFWILLLPPLVYLIIRATRLHGQGRGGAMAIVLWVLGWLAASVAMVPITIGLLSTVTPQRVATVESTITQQLAAQGVTARVSCPAIPSFSPGTVFTCTAVAGAKSALVQVTVLNWQGALSERVVSTTDGPTSAATPTS
jgi:hypothetical protein